MSKYILSIDSGTTGITILLLNKNIDVVEKFYIELNQYYPNPGWVEHDPLELIDKIKKIFSKITLKINPKEIHSIGITNQRETIVAWDKETGKPIHNAIVWQCRRTKKYCEELNEKHKKTVFSKTGLYIDSYFSASKIKWLLDNKNITKKLIKENKLLIGTIDTWIIWNLTNKKNHLTDYTNASRTMLFNINKKIWDEDLLKLFNVPKNSFSSLNTFVVRFLSIVFVLLYAFIQYPSC